MGSDSGSPSEEGGGAPTGGGVSNSSRGKLAKPHVQARGLLCCCPCLASMPMHLQFIIIIQFPRYISGPDSSARRARPNTPRSCEGGRRGENVGWLDVAVDDA